MKRGSIFRSSRAWTSGRAEVTTASKNPLRPRPRNRTGSSSLLPAPRPLETGRSGWSVTIRMQTASARLGMLCRQSRQDGRGLRAKVCGPVGRLRVADAVLKRWRREPLGEPEAVARRRQQQAPVPASRSPEAPVALAQPGCSRHKLPSCVSVHDGPRGPRTHPIRSKNATLCGLAPKDNAPRDDCSNALTMRRVPIPAADSRVPRGPRHRGEQ
jgi:hypothetical protein